MVATEVFVLFDIAIVLLVAKVFGEVAERFRVDSTVGEIAAGLLLGPVLHLVMPNGLLSSLSSLGVLMLLFLMGLSTKLDEMRGHFYSGSIAATLCALASMGGGFILGFVFFGSPIVGLVLGVATMSTSTAIPIKLLLRMNRFRTRAGQFLVAISMADDIVTILALSLLSAWLISGSIAVAQAAALFFVMIGFIYVILTAGSKVSNAILHIFQRTKDEQMLFAVPLAILFFVSFAAENLGVAAVTGAFLAGMAMANSVFAEPVIMPKIKAIGNGFFIPIFFAYSALLVDLNVLVQNWAFVAAVVVMALVTKTVAAGLLARFYGYHGKDVGVIAIGMIPRGEYEIVIAQLALGFGVITNAVYGAMIATVIVTTLLTPVLFRLYLGKGEHWQ